MAGRMWTPAELTFLRNHYWTRENDWIAKKLDRSIQAVRQKASDEGLGKAEPSYRRKLAKQRIRRKIKKASQKRGY